MGTVYFSPVQNHQYLQDILFSAQKVPSLESFSTLLAPRAIPSVPIYMPFVLGSKGNFSDSIFFRLRSQRRFDRRSSLFRLLSYLLRVRTPFSIKVSLVSLPALNSKVPLLRSIFGTCFAGRVVGGLAGCRHRFRAALYDRSRRYISGHYKVGDEARNHVGVTPCFVYSNT